MGEEGFDAHTDLEKRIGEIFDVFDHAGNKSVDVREIGTIIRALGCCPSEQDVQEVIAQVEDEQASGSVRYDKFLPFMMELIRENKMQPADPEMLLKAFLVLDEHKRGYVTKEELSKVMMEEGEQFTQEEVDEMMTVAVESDSGRIPYEYYINQIMMSKEIYKLQSQEYEKAKAEKKSTTSTSGRRSTVASLRKTLESIKKSSTGKSDEGSSSPDVNASGSPPKSPNGASESAPRASTGSIPKSPSASAPNSPTASPPRSASTAAPNSPTASPPRSASTAAPNSPTTSPPRSASTAAPNSPSENPPENTEAL